LRSTELVQLCFSCVDDTSDASHVGVVSVPTLLHLPSAVCSSDDSVFVPFVP
jgi:hypothetical protein